MNTVSHASQMYAKPVRTNSVDVPSQAVILQSALLAPTSTQSGAAARPAYHITTTNVRNEDMENSTNDVQPKNYYGGVEKGGSPDGGPGREHSVHHGPFQPMGMYPNPTQLVPVVKPLNRSEKQQGNDGKLFLQKSKYFTKIIDTLNRFIIVLFKSF